MFETMDGSRIHAFKCTEDEVVLNTEDGEVKLSLFSGRVVRGMSIVLLEDIPEIWRAPMNEWCAFPA